MRLRPLLAAWFPHPTQPGRKTVLLGGARLEEAAFGTLEFSQDGWFDFAVWENTRAGPKLLAADRFAPAPSRPTSDDSR